MTHAQIYSHSEVFLSTGPPIKEPNSRWGPPPAPSAASSGSQAPNRTPEHITTLDHSQQAGPRSTLPRLSAPLGRTSQFSAAHEPPRSSEQPTMPEQFDRHQPAAKPSGYLQSQSHRDVSKSLSFPGLHPSWFGTNSDSERVSSILFEQSPLDDRSCSEVGAVLHNSPLEWGNCRLPSRLSHFANRPIENVLQAVKNAVTIAAALASEKSQPPQLPANLSHPMQAVGGHPVPIPQPQPPKPQDAYPQQPAWQPLQPPQLPTLATPPSRPSGQYPSQPQPYPAGPPSESYPAPVKIAQMQWQHQPQWQPPPGMAPHDRHWSSQQAGHAAPQQW